MSPMMKKVARIYQALVLLMPLFLLTITSVFAETVPEEAVEEQPMIAYPTTEYFTQETKQPPRFFFQCSRMTGIVNEILSVTISSDQEVEEVKINMPNEAQLQTDGLPAGMTAQKEEASQEWVLSVPRAQHTFVFSLVIEKAGTYELFVDEETMTLEVKEQEEHLEPIPTEKDVENIIKNSDHLPIVHLVKDTSSGVLVASEINSTSQLFLYTNTIMTRPLDSNNPLGNQALQFESTFNGGQGTELRAPLYSNTNYTMSVRARLGTSDEVTNPSAVRYGVKTGYSELSSYNLTTSYSTQHISFTSNNRFQDYQAIPNELTTFYLYNNARNIQNRGTFFARVTSVTMTPNTPIITFIGDSSLEVNYSEIIGKTRGQVIDQFQKKIEEKLAVLAVDSNNNDNVVSTVVIDTIYNPLEIITQETKEIPFTVKAKKWGEEEFGVFTINIIDDIVLPVDPITPDLEIDPENKPDLPEEQGLLSIDFVSSFSFGSQMISLQDQVYYAHPQRLLNPDGTVNESEERPNYIQISDRRSEESRHGWQLAVTQNEQFETANGEELHGATLGLTNQQLITSQGEQAPALQHPNPLTLVPNTRRVLLLAQGDEGTGTWIYRFGDADTADESVFLKVPGAATPSASTYRTTLNWELAAVPENK